MSIAQGDRALCRLLHDHKDRMQIFVLLIVMEGKLEIEYLPANWIMTYKRLYL